MSNTPEKWVLHAVLSRWGAHPRLRISRINTGKAKIKGRWVKFNPKGTADVVGLVAPHGTMLMIETKSATGVQSPAQKAMQRVVTQFGGAYCLARSVDDVDRFMLERFGLRPVAP